MRVVRRMSVLVVVALVVAVLAGIVVYHERVSGWPWSGPQWAHLCGRDYEKDGSSMTLARLDRGVGRLVRLYPVYRASFMGPEIYADTAPSERGHAVGEPCSGSLYTRDGADVQVFSLSGGV